MNSTPDDNAACYLRPAPTSTPARHAYVEAEQAAARVRILEAQAARSDAAGATRLDEPLRYARHRLAVSIDLAGLGWGVDEVPCSVMDDWRDLLEPRSLRVAPVRPARPAPRRRGLARSYAGVAAAFAALAGVGGFLLYALTTVVPA